MRRVSTRLLAVSLFCFASACASQFERQLTDKGPKGQSVLAVDLSKVVFFDLTGDKELTVAEYMQSSGKEFLLLTFGSTGCGICNEKASILEQDVIGKHSLYESDEGQSFEIIGVNTDRGRPEEIEPKLRETPFIRWVDPGGLAMVSHFMPAGRKYQVPLTVMLNRQGILFRYLPEDKYSVSELMDEVTRVIGHDVVGEEPEPTPTPGPTPTPVDEVPVSALDLPRPGRLKSLAVTSCAEEATTLHDVVAEEELRLVQVTMDGTCDEICATNAATMAEVCGAGDGASCSFVTLLRDEGGAEACAREQGAVMLGGAELVAPSWLALFDHQRLPGEDLGLPAVTGSLTYGFDENGRLVLAKNGALDAAELRALAAASERPLAHGAAFPLYGVTAAGETPRDLTLADVYQKRAYTIIATFGTECTSCEAELKHWAEEGQLNDFCAANGDFCGLLLHETHEPQEPFTEVAPYYVGIRQGWEGDFSAFAGLDNLGVPMPLLLDPVSGEEDGYLARFFDGYLLARYPQWRWAYRTVIYDIEGKIVAAFPARTDLESEDPVMTKMRELKELHDGP